MFRSPIKRSNPRKKITVILFVVVIVVLMGLVMTKITADPDLGWHLRDGRYLLENSFNFPKTDPFSHSMADYPVVMHEWLTDVLMYLIWSGTGLLGLNLFFVIVTVSAFIIAARSVRAALPYQLVAALLGIIASYPILGARAQMVTLFFIALEIYLLQKFFRHKGIRLYVWLPIIFLVWANMHAGFTAGLLILFLYFFFELLKRFISRRSGRHFTIIWRQGRFSQATISGLLSITVTFLNPYGWRVYQEVYRTLTDSYAGQYIREWMPLQLDDPMSLRFLLYVGLLIILSLFAWRKLNSTFIGLAVIFGYLAFSSWRHLPLFMIITIPFWVRIASLLAGKYLSKVVYHYAFIGLLIIVTIIIGFQNVGAVLPIGNSVVKLAETTHLPQAAIAWLREHPQQGNMYNGYNWGGWIIWQLPDVPVFIDGRMAHWRLVGRHILADHEVINQAQPEWRAVFAKYHISWAFVYRDAAINYLLSNDGWQTVYSDDIAAVMVKP